MQKRGGADSGRSLAQRAGRPRWDRRDLRWLVGLTLAALAVRLIAVSLIGPRGPLFNDSLFYLFSADSLAHGHGYVSAGFPTAEWPPGYSALLAVFFKLFGTSEYLAEVVNAVLGAATVALLYLLARRIFGRAEAVVAAAALAVLPGPILWADVAVAETFYTFALVGIFLLITVLPLPRLWAVAVLGLVIGLAALVRGEALFLLVAAGAALWAVRTGSRAQLRWLGSVAVLVVAFALPLVPWTVRNQVQMHAFIPLSTNSSTTLYSGHNPQSRGAQSYAPEELLRQIPSGPDREVGEAKLLRSEAVHYARTHPSREVQLVPLKLLNLFRGDSYALDWVNAGPPADHPISDTMVVPVSVVADAGFYAMLGAAVLTMMLCGRRLWRHPAMRGVAALFLCSLVLFGFVYYGNYRYREPMSPLLLLVAAPLLARLWQQRSRLLLPGEAAADDEKSSRSADAAGAHHVEPGDGHREERCAERVRP